MADRGHVMKRLSGAFRRVLVTLGVVTIVFVVISPAASAHPLGNFSVNTSTIVRVGTDTMRLDHTVDSAEIPTVQATAAIDVDGDGTRSAKEVRSYAAAECDRAAASLDLMVDGAPVTLRSGPATLAFAEGQAGLETSRLQCRFDTPTEVADRTSVELSDRIAAEHVGWHEIVVAGDGVTISDTDLPTQSPTKGLRNYPKGQLASPLDVTDASFTASPGGPALAADDAPEASGPGVPTMRGTSIVPGVAGLTDSFTQMVASQQFTVWVVLAAVLIAIFLGSMHALAPGHGKTVMAAYLIGEQGTPRQALALCATVTLTHTAGVMILGTVLTVSTVLASERIYPVLGTLSGLIVAAVGVQLCVRTVRARRRVAQQVMDAQLMDAQLTNTAELIAEAPVLVSAGHDHAASHDHTGSHDHAASRGHSHDRGHDHSHGHDHGHGHDHDHVLDAHAHGPGAHSHGPGGHTHAEIDPTMGWRSLVAMGLAGGMVPSPSALVVLLGAIALGRTWFGAGLVLAYGLGMSLSLVAAGLLLIRIRGRVDRFLVTRNGSRFSRAMTVAPMVTASFVIIGGIWIAGRAASQF